MSLDATIVSTLLAATTTAIVGYLIRRAVDKVDAKVDQLIAKDTAQDVALVELRTRVAAVEVELTSVRMRLHRLVEVTAPLWVPEKKEGA